MKKIIIASLPSDDRLEKRLYPVDGSEYEFDIAFDMKNTIGIKADDVEGNTVEFV